MSNRKLLKKAVVVAKLMSFYKPEKLPKLMVAPNGARKLKKDQYNVNFVKFTNRF